MVGNNPGENFMGGNFPWGIIIEPSSSYNVSTLIFQKIISKYDFQ